MSLLSLYMIQNQHECILPFVQVKGNFARLQACISELRMLPREGCFRPQGTSLQLAVEDGLQQFKQYSRHMTTGTVLSYTSLEITVLTSHAGKEVVKQLEEGLKDTDLSTVRRLQVVEITKGVLECMDSASPVEEPSSDVCLKCDLQERLLSPSLLPGTADGSLRMDDPKGDFSTLYQMAAQSSACHYKLRVIKAVKSTGICESVTYGLPFILRPTSCWQLDWDELETNQQRFHALCHSLLKREWLLLAKGEAPSQGHSLREPASTFYVIVPSRSPTLLVKAVATRELMLPNSFSLLPEDLPDDSLKTVEARKEEKVDNVGAQNRQSFKIRLQCKGGNSSEGHFLLLLFRGSGFLDFLCSLPRLRAGVGLWAGRSETTLLLDRWLTCREDRAWDCALHLAAKGMKREVGTSGCAPRLTSGPMVPGTGYCGRKTRLLRNASVLDGLELEPIYNPLQIWSHLYSHLSSTFAKPQGRLHPTWENRALRKAGQLQMNRVRATVAPLPITPAPSRAPKMRATSKASSEAFFQPSREEEEVEEFPSEP
ncbi:hypothetical protein PAL_GLEAN10008546 [Pteropus alecto]|uniref:Meiosis 1 arrest protein n=1 Tax=Pteropus alecto TaxID=9402 RepID=L5L3Y3_PTEAL|nr:hypothetical protein PAL_GLEAN10008546 [Pteropus alecto]